MTMRERIIGELGRYGKAFVREDSGELVNPFDVYSEEPAGIHTLGLGGPRVLKITRLAQLDEIPRLVPRAMEPELDSKLEVFDEFAGEALRELVVWMMGSRHELIALARGRHIDGHYRYGDGNFLEWNAGEMRAAIAEELADAIVYQSRVLARQAGRVAA